MLYRVDEGSNCDDARHCDDADSGNFSTIKKPTAKRLEGGSSVEQGKVSRKLFESMLFRFKESVPSNLEMLLDSYPRIFHSVTHVITSAVIRLQS